MAAKRRPKNTITDSLGRERSATRASWGKIRTLPSGRLQASYTGPDRIRHPAPATFSTKGAAEAWLAREHADIERGVWKSPATRAAEAEAAAKRAHAENFGRYARTWVEQRVSSKGEPLRPTTRAEYERQLSKGLSEFEDDQLTGITPARVREWHSGRMKVGMTAAGAEARLLRAIMTTAVRDGIIASNPVVGSLTRASTGVKHRPPTLEELGALLEAIDPRFRAAVLLAAYGGLRLSEWRALRRRDLTFMEGRVFVRVERQALQTNGAWHVGPPKSREGERVVAMPVGLTGELRDHLAARVGPFPDDLLFPPSRASSAFTPDSVFNRAWDKARVAAGVRYQVDDGKPGTKPVWESVVREHDLRAFALSAFSVAGGTLRETQALGGHATVDAAMRYQYAAADRMAELADRMPLPGPSARLKGITH
jgi:integrase